MSPWKLIGRWRERRRRKYGPPKGEERRAEERRANERPPGEPICSCYRCEAEGRLRELGLELAE